MSVEASTPVVVEERRARSRSGGDEAVTLGDRIMVMSADRGRPKAFVDVPFARPRSVLDLRATPEYGQLFHQIWTQLRDEIPLASTLRQAQGDIVAESA